MLNPSNLSFLENEPVAAHHMANLSDAVGLFITLSRNQLLALLSLSAPDKFLHSALAAENERDVILQVAAPLVLISSGVGRHLRQSAFTDFTLCI